MSRPNSGEDLYLYISVSEDTVCTVMVREEEGQQFPIYYVSKVLKGAEILYSKLDKMALAMVTTALRLRPYFQAHTIVVRTGIQMRKVLQSPEASGRLMEWSVRLGEFDIRYEGRPALKSQALADFINEFTGGATSPLEIVKEEWTMYTDGASSSEGAGVGVYIKGPDVIRLSYAAKLAFAATNNAAEYEALVLGLKLLREIAPSKVIIYSDSKLMVNQVAETYTVKDVTLGLYIDEIQRLAKELAAKGVTWEIVLVPRGSNTIADELAKAAASLEGWRDLICPFEVKENPAFVHHEVHSLELFDKEDWRIAIHQYLESGTLPADKVEARRVVNKSARYAIMGEQLYRKSYTCPWLKCIRRDEGIRILREAHEGVCSAHEASATLLRKVRLAGFYWPTADEDAKELVSTCRNCQVHAKDVHLPMSHQRPILEGWPFATWGLDLVGPFPRTTNQKRYLIVAVDHFTKWVEAEALSSQTPEQIIQFVESHILSRFGIPYSFIADNGTQFNCVKFKEYCQSFGIKNRFASVYYPQSNGMTEVTNRTMVDGIKKRLGEKKTGWVNDINSMLWAYRTAPKTGTNETPFSLVYGVEAVVPIEVDPPSDRVLYYAETQNELYLRHHLDNAEGRRERAYKHMAAYKQRIASYHNKRVKEVHLEKGDLVLKRADKNQSLEGKGKLGITWTGPFAISRKIGPATFQLQTMSGKEVPRTWHIKNLRKYHIHQ
ncbi:RNase H family protein [Euphorbia peplus]|nr:RNase H family protein [Euphorbia peplus]